MTTPLDLETRTSLEAGLRRIGEQHGFESRRKSNNRSGDKRGVWHALGELGVTRLGLPTDADGFGAAIADFDLVMGAIGRHLLVTPFLSTAVICAPLMAACASSRRESFASTGASEPVLALAHAEPLLGYTRFPIQTTAAADADGFVLNGAKHSVLDAPLADHLLVTALTPEGDVGLFAVAVSAEGVTLDSYRTVDGQPAAHIGLAGVRARRIGRGDVTREIDDALDRAAVATCAEALGAMERVVELCHDYLKTRRAFGRSLSQFQVLQHRFVDMHVALEETRAIVDSAEAACDTAATDRAAVVAACKVATGRNGRMIAEQGVQLHGGIGMTDDFIVSHYFKRLMMTEVRYGGVEHHLGRYESMTEPRVPENVR